MSALFSFEQSVSDDIARGALDRALKRLYLHVDTIVTTPTLHPQPIGNPALDALCQQIGAKTWVDPRPITPTVPVHVYIATKLQRSGGHTRVIERLIEAHPGMQHVVLVTERMGRSDRTHMRQRFPQVRFEFCRAKRWLDTLLWLQRELVTLAPSKTHLFNHHQDSAAVAAIQPEMKLDAYFYHHGDHHLTLGATLKHFTHVDLHPMGYHQCRAAFKAENQYLPLVTGDKGPRAETPFMANGHLTTATAARDNKVAQPYFIQYADVIPTLLKATGGTHVHMGALGRRTLRRLQKNMALHGVARERFVYLSHVPSVWDALLMHKVDLYLASFPIGGGLTMVEAMGAGIPVAIHLHLTSPLITAAELAYPGALRWRFPQQLYTQLVKLTPAFLADQGRRARAHYIAHHSPALLTAESVVPAADQSAHFVAEPQAWPDWERAVNSLTQRLKQRAYRHARRLRATIDKYR